MGYENLTKGRVSESGRAYSLTMVTSGRVPHFSDFNRARFLINKMRLMHDEGSLKSLAWVLMPDHLHWLLVLEDVSLSDVMRRFKGKTGRELNLLLQLKGAFWQRGFYDRGVRENEDLKEMARYIVANPLRAGLVDNIADYPHWDASWL